MRNLWRFLLLRRTYARSPTHVSSHFSYFQVQSHSNLRTLRFSCSTLHSRPELLRNPVNGTTRCFSSEPALEPSDSGHYVFADIFGRSISDEEIKAQLESNRIEISHDLVLKALRNLDSSPDVASRIFEWVLKNENGRLSSKSYNLMLGIWGVNGFVKEFWDLVDTMKKNGYGVSKRVYVGVMEKFENDGLASDLENLRGIYALGSIDNSVEKLSSRMCKIVRQEVWGDDVEGRLRDMNVTFSSDLVRMVVENLSTESAKALIFFRWIDESGLFRHDGMTYNAMARVLGREDCIDKFWKVVEEMRGAGYEMEAATYNKVLDQFSKRKMISDAVYLYEFAMVGANKPSVRDCTFILKKIAVSKDFNIDFLMRVVKVFVGHGNVLTNSILGAVLKSLRSVDRFEECNKVLKAMQDNGLVANNAGQKRIAFGLSSAGKKDEASEFIDTVETSGSNLDYKTWTSLIEGHCVYGNLDKAYDCFLKMVGREGVSSAGSAFELLVNAYCHEQRALDAYKLLCDQVSERQLKPWHTTYKALIHKLLVQGSFEDAMNLLGLMKNHGFPPYVEPFIDYVSKSGTGEDAVDFLKAMTVKKFPSTSVFVHVFEAFFKAGRHNEAQGFLSKCPGHIRNHADVLNLFCFLKSGQDAPTTGVVA